MGNCYADDIRLEGNFATQSEISNITVNSAGQFGVNLDNFQGVGRAARVERRQQCDLDHSLQRQPVGDADGAGAEVGRGDQRT